MSCVRAGFACSSHLLGTPASAAEYDLLAGGIRADAALLLSRRPSVASVSNFAVRIGLRMLGLRATCNLPALGRALQAAEASSARRWDGELERTPPVVICPTHRSFLDFVLLVLLVDQCPLLPASARRVAIVADAEFGRLPLLGKVLERLGALFLRRSPVCSYGILVMAY